MLSVLREHEKPSLKPMLTEDREHATREAIPSLFLSGVWLEGIQGRRRHRGQEIHRKPKLPIAGTVKTATLAAPPDFDPLRIRVEGLTVQFRSESSRTRTRSLNWQPEQAYLSRSPSS